MEIVIYYVFKQANHFRPGPTNASYYRSRSSMVGQRVGCPSA